MMRLRLEASALESALRSGVAQNKGLLAVLSHALLETGDGNLKVSTNNLALRVETTIPCEVIEHGSVLVESAMLGHALSSGGQVDLKEDQGLVIKRQKGRCKVKTMDVTDWPSPDHVTWADAGIDAAMFARAIDATAFAMAKDDIRMMCRSLCVAKGFVAGTNGHRIAIFDTDYAGPQFMVPADAVKHLRRSLTGNAKVMLGSAGDGDRPVAIAVVTEFERIEASLQADWSFSDIRQVVPRGDAAVTITVRRDDLSREINTLKPFCVASHTKSIGARITVSDVLRLEDGSGENFATVDITGGGAAEICINLPYLGDALSVNDSEMVEIAIHPQDGSGRIVITDGPSTQVIAGMRL